MSKNKQYVRYIKYKKGENLLNIANIGYKEKIEIKKN